LRRESPHDLLARRRPRRNDPPRGRRRNVLSLLDKSGALGLIADLEDEVAAYFAVFGLVFADAIVPIFPGETTLTTTQRSSSTSRPLLTCDWSSIARYRVREPKALHCPA
jgi:hypothetical protein